jgi:transcription initiation factor TFIIIB Brf1 subunit/transcription initiation factor TFIIB
MIVCDDCGAIINPESVQVHYGWHEFLEQQAAQAQRIEDSLRKLRHDLLIACQRRHQLGITHD